MDPRRIPTLPTTPRGTPDRGPYRIEGGADAWSVVDAAGQQVAHSDSEAVAIAYRDSLNGLGPDAETVEVAR